MSELTKPALIAALQSADWSGVSVGNKALIQAAIHELAGVFAMKSDPLIEISRVEQMAAYYEAPHGFLEWLDLMRAAQVQRAAELLAG
jgi:hypothetical protein